MAAGMTTRRTIVASISSAIATPKPICWNETSSPAAKPTKTAMMISAAPVISRAVEATPKMIASVVSPRRAVALADATQQEDLVVHREAEEHREQEHGHPRLDSVYLPEAEEVGGDALLEDEHQDSVGGADREQIDRDRGQRDDNRAEGEREQDEGEDEDEGDHDRQPVADQREEVAVLGRQPAHQNSVRGIAEGLRHVVVPQPVDRSRGLLAAPLGCSAPRRQR